MKSFQFLKLFQIPEHFMHPFLETKQRIKLAPTVFQHIPLGNLIDVILWFEALCLKHMTFVFLMFTLSPFTFNPSFQFFNLIFNSSSDSTTVMRSLVCNSSQGHPFLNSCDRASITMIKRSGLSTDPSWTLSETLIDIL